VVGGLRLKELQSDKGRRSGPRKKTAANLKDKFYFRDTARNNVLGMYPREKNLLNEEKQKGGERRGARGWAEKRRAGLGLKLSIKAGEHRREVFLEARGAKQ